MSAVMHVIHNEAENEAAIQHLEELTAKEKPTSEERDRIELLSLLIKTFEDKNYQLKPAQPVEVLRELMHAHGLKQKDLVPIFSTPSIASEILNGKRSLTMRHVEKLADQFHVSPAVFFPKAAKREPFGMRFTRYATAKKAKRVR